MYGVWGQIPKFLFKYALVSIAWFSQENSPKFLTFFKKTVDTLRSEATEYKSFVGICCVRTKPACQHFL